MIAKGSQSWSRDDSIGNLATVTELKIHFHIVSLYIKRKAAHICNINCSYVAFFSGSGTHWSRNSEIGKFCSTVQSCIILPIFLDYPGHKKWCCSSVSWQRALFSSCLSQVFPYLATAGLQAVS